MDSKRKTKQQYKIMDTHYMKAGYLNPDRCVYCGDISVDIDHVPPISWAYALGHKYMAEEHNAPFIKVPSCAECNQKILNDKKIFTLKERKQYVAASLRENFRKLRENQSWTIEDIAEMDGRLREYVENMANYRLHIEKRIDWAESDISIAYYYDFDTTK
jgi:hypothetical protein